jgi:hypothetical protein
MEWLAITQGVTLLFLITSEILGVSPTKFNGLIDLVLKMWVLKKKPDLIDGEFRAVLSPRGVV